MSVEAAQALAALIDEAEGLLQKRPDEVTAQHDEPFAPWKQLESRIWAAIKHSASALASAEAEEKQSLACKLWAVGLALREQTLLFSTDSLRFASSVESRVTASAAEVVGVSLLSAACASLDVADIACNYSELHGWVVSGSAEKQLPHAVDQLKLYLVVARGWEAAGQLEKAEVALSEGHRFVRTLLPALSAGLQSRQTLEQEPEVVLLTVYDLLKLRTLMLWRLGQHAMALQLARQACSVLKEQAPAISGPRSASSLLIELVDALMDIAVHSTNSADTAHEGGQDGTGMPIQGSRDPAGSSAAGHATSLLQVAHEALAHAQACHDAACGGKAQLGAALRAPDANRNVHSTNQHEAASSALQDQAAQEVLHSHRGRLLVLLADCHLRTSPPDAAAALRCLDAVSEGLGTSLSLVDTATPQALRVHALLHLARYEEAEVEMMTLAAQDGAPLTLCQEAVHAMITRCLGSGPTAGATGADHGASAAVACLRGLGPILLQLQRTFPHQLGSLTLSVLGAAWGACWERKPGDAGLIPSADPVLDPSILAALDGLLTQMLVTGAEEQSAGHCEAPAARLLQHLGQLAKVPRGAEVASDHGLAVPGSGSATPEGTRLATSAYGLLFDQGALHFKQQRPAESLSFMQAALLYAALLEQKLNAYKGIALSALVTQQLERAWGALDDAHHTIMSSTTDGPTTGMLPSWMPVLRLKVCLQRGNSEGASSQLQALVKCHDYSPLYLESMVREAVNDKCHSVACDALLLLHKAVQSGAVTNHSEADILRVAVKHRELADEPLLTSYLASQSSTERPGDTGLNIASGQGHPNSAAGPCDSGPPVPKEVLAAFKQHATVHSIIKRRLDALGVAAFFGPATCSDTASLNSAVQWFFAKAYNTAVLAFQAKVPEYAAVLLDCGAAVLAHHPDPQLCHTRSRAAACLLAGVACVRLHKQASGDGSSLLLARSMLATSRQVLSDAGGIAAEEDEGMAAILGDSVTANGWRKTITYYEVLLAARAGDLESLEHLVGAVLPRLPPAQRPVPQDLVSLAEEVTAAVAAQSAKPHSTGSEAALARPKPQPSLALKLYELALQQLVSTMSMRQHSSSTARAPNGAGSTGDVPGCTAEDVRQDCDCLADLLQRVIDETPADAEKLRVVQEGVQLMGQMAAGALAILNSEASRASATLETAGAGACRRSGGGTSSAGQGRRSGGSTGATGQGAGAPAAVAALKTRRDVFPSHATKRLVEVAWNKGALHARFLRPDQALPWLEGALGLLDFTPEPYDEAHRPMMEAFAEKKRQEASRDPAPRKPTGVLSGAAGNGQPVQPAAAAGMLALPPPAPRQRRSGGSTRGGGAVLGIVGPAGGTAGAAQALTLPPMASRIRK